MAKRRRERKKSQSTVSADQAAVEVSTADLTSTEQVAEKSLTRTERRQALREQQSAFNRPWQLFERLRIPALPQPWDRWFGANGTLWILLLTVIPIFYIGFILTVGVEPWGLPENLYPWIDNDYWWHLATGDWIINNNKVPTTDPFLFTYGGDWVAHEWLGDLITAGLDNLKGYQAGIVFTWLLGIAGFWALVFATKLYGLSYRAALILITLWFGVYLRGGVIMVRPQMWTFSFFAFLFLAIAAHQTGRVKQIWFLIPLFIVWVNINLTVVFGLVCLGAYVLDRMIHKKADRALIIGGILCAFTIFVNPAHFELIEIIFKYRSTNEIWQDRIFEWMAPDLTDRINWSFALAIPMALPAIWHMFRLRLWPALPLLIVLYQSLTAVRFVVIYVLLALILAAWLVWQHKIDRPLASRAASEPAQLRWPLLLVPVGVAMAIVFWVASTYDHSQFEEEPYAWGYPVESANLVLANLPELRVFNTYDFGGYLDHRFMAEPKIYIDGRGEMYSQEFLEEYFLWIDGQSGWEEAFIEEDIGGIIIRPIDGLASQLVDNPGWRLAYADDFTLYYVRQLNPGDT